MKIRTCIALGVLCAAAGVAHAETTVVSAKKNEIGADAAVALPVGDFADGAGFGFGAMARYQRRILPKLRVTGRAGYVHHLEKNNVTVYEVPFLAGIKYDFHAGGTALYAGTELGFNLVGASIEGGGGGSETNLAMGAGVGWEAGKLDVRAQIFLPDVGDAMSFMVTAGYGITAL